jgi:hypothetical protein
MISTDCPTCKVCHLCPPRQKAKHNREAVVAWANDRATPECPFYAERTYHGIDGVFDYRECRV